MTEPESVFGLSFGGEFKGSACMLVYIQENLKDKINNIINGTESQKDRMGKSLTIQ